MVHMTATALAIYLLFALLALVWRGWLQYRRTGDHGFRGLSGRFGSIEWLGGCLVTLGAFASPWAAVAELRGDAVGMHFFLPTPLRAAGIALMVLGLVMTLVAQLEMGASWRVGVDASEATELVTTGVFRWVRNPIFAAMLALSLGLVLAVPNLIACAAFIASLAGIELHVRAVEEPYLTRVHGERYLAYARRVGRFVPGVGRFK
jgi:protein-S-isoprenylcysteine O-methyltransferase Ste14